MNTSSTSDLFGQISLGYQVIESERFTEWRRFGEQAIGMHADDLQRDAMRFRLDDHACRFLVRRGPAEDVVALGWQAHDHETFDGLTARLHDAGVPAVEADPDEAALRGVERLLRSPGPKDITQEFFTTPVLADTPPRLQASGFVTGAAGMGHVALTTTNPAQMRSYFTHLLDARLSDYIDETMAGIKLKIRFLRVNQRHHSVAIASTRPFRLDPIRTRVQHLNVQVANLEDMVGAYTRVKDAGFDMALGVGQHTNDRELSFYCVTPSGFEWEVGWNPLEFDSEREATWKPTTYQGISIWGHTPVGQTIVDQLERFGRTARSAFKPETTVDAISGPGLADGEPDPVRIAQLA